MKFSLVISTWFVQLPLCARPAGDEHGLRAVEHDENTDNTNITWLWGDHPRCTGGIHAKDCLAGRCKMPGHYNKDKIWTHTTTGWFGRDYHDECTVKCCDTSAEIHDDRCKCTPYGKKYRGFGWRHGVVDADSPAKCCGRNANNDATTLENYRCGCTEVNMIGGWGTKPERDCCSLAHDHENKCVAGPCAKKGSEGLCCRIKGNNEKRVHSPKCSCFHYGQVPNPNDIVNMDNCCSGKADAAGTACGCIMEGDLPKDVGAGDIDCCSGRTTSDKKTCVALKCTPAGEVLKKGDHCCSDLPGTNEEGKAVCLCLKSGKTVPHDGVAHDCCSGKMDKDRMCSFLKTGDVIINGTKAADVCLSGEANVDGACRCIAARASTKDPKQCCSGHATADGKCGCMAVDDYLNDLARPTDCCTETATADGVCRCAAAGAPIPNGNKTECCAGADASGKFCSCFPGGKNSPIVDLGLSEHCCGGSYNWVYDACVSIMPGYAVGSWVPASACSVGRKDGDTCAHEK